MDSDEQSSAKKDEGFFFSVQANDADTSSSKYLSYVYILMGGIKDLASAIQKLIETSFKLPV